MMSASRGRFAALVAATALTALCTFGAGTAANAAPAAAPATTPTATSVEGELNSYVVNANKANPGQVRKVENAVVAAGGVVVQTWPEIGVIVAHSTSATFRQDVVKAGKNSIESVGATRTTPVTEGTPAGVQAPWGPGASSWKGQVKPSNGDIDAPTTPATTTDPREKDQWDMTMIGADKAHAVTDGSRNLLVGVLDSGIDPDHPDLQANISIADSVNCGDAGRPDSSATGWYPTTSDHGTHVAGTIAAARNGVGITGVAPNVRLASVKVVNDGGFIYPEYAVCGFMWAAERGMDITNNSYYVDPWMFLCDDDADQAASYEAVRRAVAWSQSRGVLNVAALGNAGLDVSQVNTDDSSPNDTDPIARTVDPKTCHKAPADVDGVVTVTSVTSTKALSYFSNRGLGEADVAAPGSSILSTIVNNNGWGTKSGTSMASPHVTGVLALMKSVHPDWSNAKLTQKLFDDATATPCSAPQANYGPACVGDTEYNSYYGHGIVNALAAVQ
ncbi:S8 family peptidase [Microbacterium gorillae]|uniref:S8 family peptidase n=1 Tax=Microbacterium gorillae TaxID=1231063 RepID=UPI000ADE92EA|nr:S8 family serine peptidase [Microbacterium gorillae]